jgi:hypothetical protein
MELKSDSVRRALDAVPISRKVTGHAATVEIVAYPDGHAGIVAHPLNGRQELLAAVEYLFDRLRAEAVAAADRK